MSAQTPSGPAHTSVEPTAKERLSWMRKNTRVLLAALVLLLIALAIVAFSSGLFTSSSANPGNLASSGVMTIDNDREGEAILTAERLLPGESGEGTVSVTNVGDADGDFTLRASSLADDPADPAFSEVLTLTITEGGDSVYDGPLADIDTVDLGTWAADEEHTYTFTVTFDVDSENEYQGASTTLDFAWDATQS